jgi:Tfp pilus assembly protein PilF
MTEGDKAYAAGDFTAAAREYIAAAGSDGAGSGAALHKAGNALLKLRRFDDAIVVYERALDDIEYTGCASVRLNLGTAYAAIGESGKAAAAYEQAVDDPLCTARHKGLAGLGGSLYDMGRIEDAAEAYRKAALDSKNPDPGRALNNLGLCFMALDRPEDAMEAYRAAVELKGYAGRGRAAANLGLAYAALGMHEHAVRIFERADREFGHELSHAATAAYAACAAMAARAPEKVEGWSTGELSPVAAAAVGDPEPDQTRFFTITDDEMRVADKTVRGEERRERRKSRPTWVIVLVVTLALAAIGGLLAFVWLTGLGYPSQQMTVTGMLDAYGSGQAVDSYWVAVPSGDVEKAMASLPPKWQSLELGAIERSARTSTVEVTVVLEQGAPLTYQVSLAREGVGWKVNGVINDWRSTGGGS